MMGEYADMIIEGYACPCGEYLGNGQGFPQYCSQRCAHVYGGISEEPSAKCPHCDKTCKGAQGVADHVRAKHPEASS